MNTDAALPGSTPSTDALVQRERVRAARRAAWQRFGASASFAVLVLVGWLARPLPYWLSFVAPLGMHVVLSGLLLADVRRSSPRFPTWVGVPLDFASITWAMWAGFEFSDSPPVLATFSLALFICLQLLSAQLLENRQNLGLAAGAFAAFVALGVRGGLTGSTFAAGAMLIGVSGLLAQFVAVRRLALATLFGEAEAARARVEGDRRRIEDLLAEARQRTEQLERVQADNRLLTQLIVHDLRAPLTALAGNVEWLGSLARKGGREREADEAVEDLLHGVDRMSTLIGTLLDAGKLEEGRLSLEREPVLVGELLGRVARQARVGARARRIEVVLDASPMDPLRIDVDRVIAQRVLENLVTNALRFAREGGRIRLSFEHDAGGAHVLVQNDGDPIPDARRSHLFAKYLQLDATPGQSTSPSPRVGWGLGLYFCRLAAEAHGGSIGVVDREGWPTTFRVTFPVAKA